MAKGYLTADARRAMMEATMAFRSGDEELEIEAKVEHVTLKAWLIIDNMSGNQAWLPKSVGRMVRDRDADGNCLFIAPEWWAKKNGFI